MLSLRALTFAGCLSILALLLPPSALAQSSADPAAAKRDPGAWQPSLEAGFQFTQSAFSDNWAGGDKGTVVWTSILNASLERQFNPRVHWTNTLKLAYGQSQSQNDGRHWEKPSKSTDRIDLESILRWTLEGPVDPYASGRLESQFQDASDPEGRTLLFNPVLLRESVGISHQFYPDEESRSLLVRLGGVLREGMRKQFVNADPNDTESTRQTGLDGGVELLVDYKTQLFEDKVAWTSKLGFVQPLFYSQKSDLQNLAAADLIAAGVDPDVADYTTTLDVDWENVFTSQITSVLSVNLYVRWVYDKYDTTVKPRIENGTLANPEEVAAAIRKAGQFKQTLALGLTYRFF
jgi:hypothetical protein